MRPPLILPGFDPSFTPRRYLRGHLIVYRRINGTRAWRWVW